MSVANTTIVARLARDPETKSTDRGLSICKLTLPVDNRRTDSTTWWTATLFGKAADIAMQHLSKGAWVAVSGAAHVRIYDKKDGSKGFSAELDNCSFNFVGPKQQQEEQGRPRQQRQGDPLNSPDIPF